MNINTPKVRNQEEEKNKHFLIQTMITIEENELMSFQFNREKLLLCESNYNDYYKEFERLAKIYEKMAHHYNNKNKFKLSLRLFNLASLLYKESGDLRKKCQSKFYSDDKNIYNFNKHIEAYTDCFYKKERCENNFEKIKKNLIIK